MTAEVALRIYEDYLLGKGNLTLKVSGLFEMKGDIIKGSLEEIEREQEIKMAKEADALAIVRYAVTKILGWTPSEAMEHINKDIVCSLKLEPLIKYIDFPSELSKSKDFWWLIYKAFPMQSGYNNTEHIVEIYKKILNGELKNFPTGIFHGPEGIEKLTILLHYYITNNIPASQLDDLYKVFAKKSEAIKMLKEAQLFYAFDSQYATPLDWLHDSLGEDGDVFLYQYYQFMDLFNQNESSKKLKRYMEQKENERLMAEIG